MRRTAQLLTLLAVSLATSGCSSLWRGAASPSAVAPSGLPWGEELVRRALVMGTYDQALARTQKRGDGAPDDELLRALFQGQAAYYAGDWEQSTASFAEADRLTEARFTKSASRGLLSLVANDRALRYVPARTERLFSPFYAMLARMQAGDVAGATVDARRLSALLEASAGDLDASEHATHAALRDATGAVFEAAGEWNDASVAYRNAALLRGAPREAVDSIVASAPPADSATLVVVVESGFAAHYVSQSVAFPLSGASGRNRRGGSSRPDRRQVTAEESDDITNWLGMLEAEPGGGVFLEEEASAPAGAMAAAWTPNRSRGRRFFGGRGWGGAWLEVSWPVLVRSRLPVAPVQLVLASAAPSDGTAGPEGAEWTSDSAPTPTGTAWQSVAAVPGAGATVAQVSDALGADARRLRGPRLARLAARTVTRVAAVEAVREKHGEAAGAILGLVASAVERADTRAWHLLPGRLAVVRVTVPAGPLEPMLMVGATLNPQPMPLAPLTARAGGVHVQTTRIWRDPAGAPSLTAAAGQGVLSLPH